MSYTVGQQASLSTLVKDVNGNAIDATVSLVVTRPDGSTVSPSMTHPGTGQYAATVPLTMAGSWLYVWSASGAAIGVDDGQFEVTSVTVRIISLADAKRHLNIPLTDTTPDDELQDFIDAAQAMIEREIGPVVPKTYTEAHSGGTHRIVLNNGPIVSVTNITEYLSGSLLKVLTTSEYLVDTSAGYVSRILTGGYAALFQGYTDDVVVTYLAGRPYPVPANIRLGARELTGHLWRNSQIGRSRRNPRGAGDEDAAPISLAFSMPARVKELIGAGRPVIL